MKLNEVRSVHRGGWWKHRGKRHGVWPQHTRLTGSACRQLFRVLRRHFIRRTRNVPGEREIDGAHDDRPTINSNNSKPVPHIGLAISAKAISSMFQVGSRGPHRDFGLPAVSATRGENFSGFCRQIACREDVAESPRHSAQWLCLRTRPRKIRDSRPREWLRPLTSSRICRPTRRHSQQRILARPGCA